MRGSKFLNLIKQYSFVVLCVFVFSLLCSCGGGALPQTSLPLPSNDPITVSAPNSSGFVVITGASEAVPNGAKVIIQVGSATALLNFYNDILNVFVSPAFSQTTCTSTLPQCPSLDSDNKCQAEASSDGSFTILAPASLNDQISVNYLDLTSCKETSAYTKTVSSSILSLDVDAKSLIVSTVHNKLFVGGNTSSGVAGIAVYDFSTADSVLKTTTSFTGTLTKLSNHVNYNSSEFLIAETSQGVSIGPVSSIGDFNMDNFIRLKGENGEELPNLKFLSAVTLSTQFTQETCTLDIPLSSQNYSRLFFYDAGYIYVLDFGDTLSEVSSVYVDTSGYLKVRKLPISLGGDTVSDVVSFKVLVDTLGSDFLTMVASFNDTTGTKYKVFKTDAILDYCIGPVDFPNSTPINLGYADGAIDSNIELWNYLDSTTTTTTTAFSYALLFLKYKEQTLTIVNLDTVNMFCNDHDVLSLDGSTSITDSANDCLLVAGTGDKTTPNLDLSNGLLSKALRLEIGTEIFIVGNQNGGADFLVESGSSSFKTSQSVNAIAPVGVKYDELNNQIMIVDSGVDGDGLSNIILYKLNNTPL